MQVSDLDSLPPTKTHPELPQTSKFDRFATVVQPLIDIPLSRAKTRGNIDRNIDQSIGQLKTVKLKIVKLKDQNSDSLTKTLRK